MKKVLLLASGFLLVVPEMALAQQAQTRPAPGATKPAPPGRPQIQPPRPGGPQIQPPRPRPEIQPPRPGRPGAERPRPPHRPGAGRPPHFRPIHRPGWNYPRGYHYRRWVIGSVLPRLFLSTRYYFNDYASLGVGPPPRGYRWVRYGPDLLLVGTRTGKVYDVIRGAFY